MWVLNYYLELQLIGLASFICEKIDMGDEVSRTPDRL